VTAIAALERGRRTAPPAATVKLLAEVLGLGQAERSSLVEAAASTRDATPAPKAPPRQASTPRNNLPAEVSTFVGREEQTAQVARLLTSARSVEMHVGHILAKLGLSSRTQVAVWAVENVVKL